MNDVWQFRRVPFKFMLSDKTIFAPTVWLQVREIGLADDASPTVAPTPPTDPLEPRSQGFLIRSMRVAGEQAPLRKVGNFICYVSTQYPRYYVDLKQSFDSYKSKFSSKTRSTINRKIKRFTEHCDGTIDARAYRSPSEMREFYRLARLVSVATYQERLLDAGLPDSDEFHQRLMMLAAEDQVRGYILFDDGRPVSYLYCPIRNGVLLYQYLGYDPQYSKWSVGTVLQWCAFQSIFAEGKFQLFDFTEGQSEHKRMFATGSVPCANVYFLQNTIRNISLIQGQRVFFGFSELSGDILERLGLKARIKKLLRFGY